MEHCYKKKKTEISEIFSSLKISSFKRIIGAKRPLKEKKEKKKNSAKRKKEKKE